MDRLLRKLSDSSADAVELAKSVVDSGIQSVSGLLGGVRVFSSLTAMSPDEIERDETHYVLVPIESEDAKHAIYTKRVLPPDIGVTNSLPKVRIFHLPDRSGQELIEHQLVSEHVDGNLAKAGESEFADVLDRFAEQIDRESNRVTGGLLLIGGAVAFLNPLVGLGIAAKSLLPSLGAKATQAGVDFVGGKFRKRSHEQAKLKLEKEAGKKLRKGKVEIFENPLIRSLEAVVTNPSDSYDPFLDRRNWVDEFDSHQYYTITIEAIREVYADAQQERGKRPALNELHLRWVEYLGAQAESC